jgi:hypothetical protein
LWVAISVRASIASDAAGNIAVGGFLRGHIVFDGQEGDSGTEDHGNLRSVHDVPSVLVTMSGRLSASPPAATMMPFEIATCTNNWPFDAKSISDHGAESTGSVVTRTALIDAATTRTPSDTILTGRSSYGHAVIVSSESDRPRVPTSCRFGRGSQTQPSLAKPRI